MARAATLVVSIGVSLADALADWRASTLWDVSLLSTVTLVLMLAAAAMSRQQVRRERAEQKLAETALHVQAIVDHAADAIVSFDHHGHIESVNRTAEALFDQTGA